MSRFLDFTARTVNGNSNKFLQTNFFDKHSLSKLTIILFIHWNKTKTKLVRQKFSICSYHLMYLPMNSQVRPLTWYSRSSIFLLILKSIFSFGMGTYNLIFQWNIIKQLFSSNIHLHFYLSYWYILNGTLLALLSNP